MSHRIYLSPPDMSERERAMLLQAFDSGWVAPAGPDLQAFEREMCAELGVAHAVALSSGTAALHLALLSLDIGIGDIVLCSTCTFAATVNAIRYVGATPVFIDSDRASWNMDPELLAEELDAAAKANELPAAVIVVDLYGQCADYRPILEACERYDVPVIEDAAEALGSGHAGRRAGAFGTCGVLSFNGNKIMTTGGGGMLVSNRAELIDRARKLATQARDPAPHYQHSSVGYNYRLSNLLAAVGRGQLQRLAELKQKRLQIHARYREALDDKPIEWMPRLPKSDWNGWLTCITLPVGVASPESLRLALEQRNIEARPTWKPMHQQPAFASCRVRGGAVADDVFARGLCLPSGSSMSGDDIDRVVEAVRNAL